MSSIVRTAAAVACTGACILLAVALVSAQNPTLQGRPEDYVRADIEYGARLYAQQCVNCHGGTGDGVAGVDLRSGKFRTAQNDLQLRTVITNGFPNTGMPRSSSTAPSSRVSSRTSAT